MKERAHFLPEDVTNLPQKPGIYLFYGQQKKLLYVGKAKDLKKRVKSYFRTRTALPRKTANMMQQVKGIEVILTPSEQEALLMENHFVKSHQPKYNVLLRDDKSYPLLCLVRERFPRLVYTRKKNLDGEYFGPYTQVKAMKCLFKLLQETYTLRTCNYRLSEKNVQQKKYKVCLEYHMKRCLGPCESLETDTHYEEKTAQVRQILRGRWSLAKQHLSEKMKGLAKKLRFEEAQEYKRTLEKIRDFQARSLVVNPKLNDIDVASMVRDNEGNIVVNYLQVKEGMVLLSDNLWGKSKVEERDKDVMQRAVIHFVHKYKSQTHDIVTNVGIDSWREGLRLSVPIVGDKRKLVLLSEQNALLYKEHIHKTKQKHVTATAANLETLQKELHMKLAPTKIECVDISNLGANHIVGAVVCFKYGKPSKKDYRQFGIKSVTKEPNDVASMKEVLTRHYTRHKKEKRPLPQLLVVDGGKGQLNAACEVLKNLGLYGQLHVVGIAKRLEEIYTPEDPIPLLLSKKSRALQLIQKIRNETHRFVIQFHRNQRSKSTFQSVLNQIKGIGPKTQLKLRKTYPSVEDIQQASLKELGHVVGPRRASEIKEHLSLL